MKILSSEQLDKLSTKRLLAYKRKLYRRFFVPDSYQDNCYCWLCDSVRKIRTSIKDVKSVLNTREHSERKKK